MDLTKGKIRNIYFKYLGASFGSALISSVYGLADTAMVGHYHGPMGTAAMAVVAPIWNLVYSLGILSGLGGAVLMSNEKGKGSGRENSYFTLGMIYTFIIAAVVWAVLLIFDEPMLYFFGADAETIDIALEYTRCIRYGAPLFVLNQAIAAFLRNDSDPQRGTIAVLSGGLFNLIGDYICIFVLDMGAFGAGLATTLGALITCIILCTHFFTKKNTLKFVKTRQAFKKIRRITVNGFSSFFVDLAMGILTLMFNRQIMKYLGNDALAVYGVIVNISTMVQSCTYSVGQSAQPLFSVNYGAGKYDRVKGTLRYALFATAFFTVVWTAVMMIFPNGIMGIFMDTTDSVLSIAPDIVRVYCLSFLLLPFNIFSTYYFQSLLKPVTAFIVSVGRGMVLSGILIYALPALLGADAIWFAMPVTELVIAVFAVIVMRRYTKQLGRKIAAV